MQDKASAQGSSKGSMNRASPLLGGMGSTKPTWQGSPHKSTQPSATDSKSLFVLPLLHKEVITLLYSEQHDVVCGVKIFANVTFYAVDLMYQYIRTPLAFFRRY